MSTSFSENPNLNRILRPIKYQYETIFDRKKLLLFEKWIRKNSKNKRILFCGSGLGLLAILAVGEGAEQVYILEENQELACFTDENIVRSGLKNKITLLIKKPEEITLEELNYEKLDWVINQSVTPWQIGDSSWNPRAKMYERVLKKNGHVMPQKIRNELDLVQGRYSFGGISGTNEYFSEVGISEEFKPLSDLIEAMILDPLKEIPETFFLQKQTTIHRDGAFTAVRLRSAIQMVKGMHLKHFEEWITPIFIPSREKIRVKRKQRVEIFIKCRYPFSWSDFQLEFRPF